jgi:hypothetical protein
VLPPLSPLREANEAYTLNATTNKISEEYFTVKVANPNITKLVLYATNEANTAAEAVAILPIYNGLAHVKNTKVTFIKGLNRHNELSKAFSMNKEDFQ